MATGVVPLATAGQARADDAGASGTAGRPGDAAQAGPRGAVSTSWTENWESGFVTGNGNLGAVLYGRPESPVVLVNNSKLYTSQYSPEQRTIAETAAFVPQIRETIKDQGYAAMLDWSFQQSKAHGLAPDESIDYHPGLFLNCSLTGADQASDYRRAENFETGEVTTTWQGTAGSFATKAFASRPDNVVVIQFTGPGAGALSATFSLGPVGTKQITPGPAQGPDWIGFHNLYAPGNGGYDGVVTFRTRGGTLAVDNGTATVQGADEILVLIRIERWRPPQTGGVDELARQLHRLPADYNGLIGPHAAVHGELYNRVSVDFGGGADRGLTTDALLAQAVRERTMPKALLEKVYDACRYVVLSASGDLPPNLQGIWNGNWSPPWHSDYSADANLQLAVDSTVSGAMPELMEGFFSLIESGVPSWQEGATKLAGCRGILYPARMQDQGTYFQQNHDWQWFNQVSIAGWLGHYFYDQYRYTGDLRFLRDRALPYLKECALFYEDWWVRDADGTLRSTPSFSYECAFADNATIDFAVAKEVLTNLIEGCTVLGIEADGVARWRELLTHFPAYMINTARTTGGTPPPNWQMETGVKAVADGSLKEFIEPNMLEFPAHRHLSSLYPLFVSHEFSPEDTPELWTAAARSYEKKIRSVGESESHYRMQASLCAARLGRGDDIWNFLTLMAADSVFHTSLVPSHYDNLNVFNVDASGGIPAVLHNALVFSAPGRLDLLPALPSALGTGAIRGILARGRVTVEELVWDYPSGTVTATLHSGTRQSVELSLPPGLSDVALTVGARRRQVGPLGTAGRTGTRVTLPAGRTRVALSFTPIAAPPTAVLLSYGATATASSTRTSDGDVTPDKTVDNNSSTRWTSDYADNQWLQIDLGAVHSLTEVKLNWETATARDFAIDVSADGHTWTTVTNVTGNTASGWMDFPNLSVSGRYVRLDLITRATSYGFSLWDVEVYGS
ncbi:glycosyl hydrolase family 95 catalytic domain-containing protein [Actinacidiphila acididurans]|uniref:Glycoside hydrolase N-terminal domain-containing protein n=1 Tax=Actinacidiphila acididurans TaxID=2784346 RepID=A0ABS2TZF3_9ACTN|nr:glycoside hydrolase N-terminal domain-containing protein [Actinacidiphila acididurans]MBM9508712.1 glycoside hydrolase N-terminal domain-containing protein [Actinacidiphila acididurans]